MTNVDSSEIDKFSERAHHWWDPHSIEFKLLHDINPLRLDWIDQRAALKDKTVVDIGCGGGLLSEGMASRGAQVTGIDLSENALSVARLHLLESGAHVDYHLSSPEAFAEQHPAAFDVVTCLEVLEHVIDPASVVSACATLVKPGGQVFLSTLNRNVKSYLLAIVAAEYLLRMMPPGTHDYKKFIRPSELKRACANAGLDVTEMTGLHFNPLTRRYAFGPDVSVNYLLCAARDRA